MMHQLKKALLDEAADISERGTRKTAEVNDGSVRALLTRIGGVG